MIDEFQLPDGTWASSVQDIDRYCQQTGSSWAGDYSGDYMKNRRFYLEKAQQDDLLADFIYNYKKEIWKQ